MTLYYCLSFILYGGGGFISKPVKAICDIITDGHGACQHIDGRGSVFLLYQIDFENG